MTPEQGKKVTVTCGISTSPAGVRSVLPDKGAFQQIRDGVTTYLDGLAYGVTTTVARTGAFGPALKQEADALHVLVSESTDIALKNPGLAASIIVGYSSKYPYQAATRLGLGVAVSRFFSPQVGVPATVFAYYGNGIQAASQNLEGFLMALTVGEVCNQEFDGQP